MLVYATLPAERRNPRESTRAYLFLLTAGALAQFLIPDHLVRLVALLPLLAFARTVVLYVHLIRTAMFLLHAAIAPEIIHFDGRRETLCYVVAINQRDISWKEK